MVLFFATMVFLGVNLLIAKGNPIMEGPAEDRELILAFLVNRHGERTPDEDELSFSDIKETILDMTCLEGPEGLTNLGKRRAYQIGKFIRQRYGSQGNKLISNYYLRDEISIRSTDKERTKMTAEIAMAATYPPEKVQQWDEGVGKIWQPVPYTAIPLSEDYLRFYGNCDRYKTLMAEAKIQSLDEEYAPYKDLMQTLETNTGRNFTENPLLFQTLTDLFHSQVSMDLGVPEWAQSILPQLREASTLAYKMYFRSDEMKKIGGGVILNDFVEAAASLASGKTVPKRLRIFSAHDFNVGSLMEVTGAVTADAGIPEYGSLFGLELYKTAHKEFSVLPIYLTQAGNSSVKETRFKDCATETYCDLDTFREFTKKYLLPEKEFYRICNIRTEL